MPDAEIGQVYDLSNLPELTDEYRIQFPDPEECDHQGIIGYGGNLSPGVLLSAYEQGFFPWYGPGEPIIWWSPDPRFTLQPDQLHVSRRTLRDLKKSSFRVSADRDFPAVIEHCSKVSRQGQSGGTWITDEMRSAYIGLHELGYAHSIEVRDEDDVLIGGLYGINRGHLFCGESMFSLKTNASKLALMVLARFLRQSGADCLIDSQVSNPHMASLGGADIQRSQYISRSGSLSQKQDLSGWNSIDISAEEVVEEYRSLNI